MNPFCGRRRVQTDVMAWFVIVRKGLCELFICVRACPSSVPAWKVHVCVPNVLHVWREGECFCMFIALVLAFVHNV